MHHPNKKQMIQRNNEVASAGDLLASFDRLSVDDLANIFKFLSPEVIMMLRQVSKQCREGAKKTIVPPCDFKINSVKKYNALSVMTVALPNLQQITLCDFRCTSNKYSDGEDPYEHPINEMNISHLNVRSEWSVVPPRYTSHNIGIICNFSKLRILEICAGWTINGGYNFLFRSFPLLQKLCIGYSPNLKMDLEVLAGLPLLKELELSSVKCLTGNVNCLRGHT